MSDFNQNLIMGSPENEIINECKSSSDTEEYQEENSEKTIDKKCFKRRHSTEESTDNEEVVKNKRSNNSAHDIRNIHNENFTDNSRIRSQNSRSDPTESVVDHPEISFTESNLSVNTGIISNRICTKSIDITDSNACTVPQKNINFKELNDNITSEPLKQVTATVGEEPDGSIKIHDEHSRPSCSNTTSTVAPEGRPVSPMSNASNTSITKYSETIVLNVASPILLESNSPNTSIITTPGPNVDNYNAVESSGNRYYNLANTVDNRFQPPETSSHCLPSLNSINESSTISNDVDRRDPEHMFPESVPDNISLLEEWNNARIEEIYNIIQSHDSEIVNIYENRLERNEEEIQDEDDVELIIQMILDDGNP